MAQNNINLHYNKNRFSLILKDSYNDNVFYGVDILERKILKIILAKYGCTHCYHTIPDTVTLDVHPFRWSKKLNKLVLDDDEVVNVKLNTLEESIVTYSEVEGY